MENIENKTNFPIMSISTWYNRKHILGFCNTKLDYSTDLNTHRLFEYVYFCVTINNDCDQIIIDDEGNKYSSHEEFEKYIEKHFPGYLKNGQCYASIAYQCTQLGIRHYRNKLP